MATLASAPPGQPNWAEWVGVSGTRNLLREDPILDWLDYYALDSDGKPRNGVWHGYLRDDDPDSVGYLPECDFAKFIALKSAAFKAGVRCLLEERLMAARLRGMLACDSDLRLARVAECHADYQDPEKVHRTLELMCAGVPAIAQGVLWDEETKTYGSPSLLVRSDALRCLVETEPKGDAMKAANYYHKLYYHRLGTPQSTDKLIYQRTDQPEWGFTGDVTEDGRYLVITVSNGTAHENRIYVKDLAKANAPVQKLFDKADASYGYVSNLGTKFLFQTDKGAPLGKLVSVDLRHPQVLHTVLPESKDTLAGVSNVGGRLFATYLKDAHSAVRVYTPSGKLVKEVGLPGIGSAGGFGGHQRDTETFYTYSSYTTPPTIYRYDVRTGASSVFRKPKVAFDGSKYETHEVFVPSKDGTKVPAFLTYRKGLKKDGRNPTLMYGYGGFNINETPVFSSSRAVWLDMGGMYVDVVLRGGSEYGEKWHQAGRGHNKQNVFDDFISVAEWLIANGYTSTPKLACSGGSNGGLLVGAVLTQRPDLWGATLPDVGVMDMLRFNKFTIGYAWMTEYGNPDTAEDFPTIYKYSPLHNIKPGTSYPPTLIGTADHDDRVFPAHSFKFAAALQAAQAGPAPVLIRIETDAGHGAGKPISKIIEEIADKWAFLKKNLGM